MNESEMNQCIQQIYFDRKDDSIKSDFGRCLLIGGCKKYPNAIVISSNLASYSGNGYCGLAVPNVIYSSVSSRVLPTQIFELSISENDISFTEDDFSRILKTYQSILFGNGLNDSERNLSCLKRLLQDYAGNLVIDATGIMLLAKDTSVLSSHSGNILLTPHLKEAAALFHLPIVSRHPEDYFAFAKQFASKYQVYLLLKSFVSYLVCPDGRILASEYAPTPSLAKAGSGDGLAGYLTGLLAYADKKIGYEKTILFADKMIHEAALNAQQKYSPGIADILYAGKEIVNIIHDK